MEAVAGLTAVDGATVLTTEYELLAFGAKIARRKGWPQVEHVTLTEPIEGGVATILDPTELGGTRHLAAAQFAHDSARLDSARGVAGRPLHPLRLVAARGDRARTSGRDATVVSAFQEVAQGFSPASSPRGRATAQAPA